MQTVPSNNDDSIELNNKLSNENMNSGRVLDNEPSKQKDQVNNHETSEVNDRISNIPKNISNIRRDNVEFERNVVQQPKHKRIFKIIVIGDSNVGKNY